MIEKINTEGYESISIPSENVVNYLEEFLENSNNPISVAEVGVGVGATSVEIAKRLRSYDSFYFFSFEKDVRELEADLNGTDYCKCKLYPMGNSGATYDSYNWKLSSLCYENKMMFDLAYLDGSHSFFHDALATILLKRLIKPGGILIFDDVFWTGNLYKNPDLRSRAIKDYTPEQLETEQIKRVIDLFMENDEEWERLGDIRWQTVYRKVEYNDDVVDLKKEIHNLKKTLNNLETYNTARIDIKNQGNELNSIKIIENSDSSSDVLTPEWFKDKLGMGTVIQSNKNHLNIKIECINEGKLRIVLRGIYFKENNKRIPIYVKYLDFQVNNERIFQEPITVWHDEPYIYEIPVSDLEKVDISINWVYDKRSLSIM